MLISAFTPLAALAVDGDYILNISDAKIFNHTNNTTTQDGSADLSYYGGPGSSITSNGQDKVSDEPIKVTQTIMSDWQGAFQTEAKNFSVDKNTVVDIEFKVYLDDYSKPSPYVGLRLYTKNNYINCNGMEWRGMKLTSGMKDKRHHMRYVFSKDGDGNAAIKYSLDGADYKTTVISDPVIPADAENWGRDGDGGDTAMLRFMPVSLPSVGRDGEIVDGETPLDTPVNWEFYSFKAYQTDEEPEPPKATPDPSEADKEYILNLSDQKYFDDTNNTISQTGSETVSFFGTTGATRVYSDAARTVSSEPIKVEQTKASEYKTVFKIPGKGFTTDKNIVLDVKFKVSLADYTKDSPFVGVKLFHEKTYINETNSMTWKGRQITEKEKDKMHTVRFVIASSGNETNPNCARIYYSYDGAAYSIEDRSEKDLTTIANYGQSDDGGDGLNFRLAPVAIPKDRGENGENFNVGTDDGTAELPTTVNWEIYSMTAYQTDDIPDPITGTDNEEYPTANPVPTAVPIPSELKDSIVRAYPDGKMKAAVISLDDGADWCVDQDLKAIEILRRHNAKATFNIVPGNYAPRTLENLKEYYAGMEVASHSNTHPQLDEATNDEFLRELELSKTTLDNNWGSPIGGLAYPYACSASSDPVRLGIIQSVGYRYARNCIMTGKYDVPASFYDLNPTGWVSVERDWQNGTTEKFMDEFKALDASSEWKMLFLAGHAWQFSADEDEPRGDIWDKFEIFAKYLEDNSDTIWNPTTIELVDYVTACRQLTVTNAPDGVKLYNPSDITVWANVDGVPTPIEAGETVSTNVIAEAEEKPFIADSYILDIDDNITVNDQAGAITEGGGMLNSTSGVMSGSTSDVFIVRQQKKSIWGGYLQVLTPAPATIAIDKPIVIESRYKVTLDDYETGASPKARLALALTNFNIYANSNVSAEIYTPGADDGYRTVKFVIDPVTGKVYTISDGRLINEFKCDNLNTNALFENGIRLYMNVCPADDNMSNDGDAETDLVTSVYWNFDYIKMYKLNDDDTLRIVSGTLDIKGDTADYAVRVRNDHPSVSKHAALAVALYDESGRLVDVEIKEFDGESLTKTAFKGSLNTDGLSGCTAKAFVWDSAKSMTPISDVFGLEQ